MTTIAPTGPMVAAPDDDADGVEIPAEIADGDNGDGGKGIAEGKKG